MRRSAWLVLAATLAGCGADSPSDPAPATSIVTLGPQVLRISPLSPCMPPLRVFPLHTRVSVTRSGNGWVATANSAGPGDVQVRFHLSGGTPVPGTARVAGTIVGTAVHIPEMLSVPTGGIRADFGTEGRTVLDGVAFSAGSYISSTPGIDGMGTGSFTVIDETTGQSCTASTFSWSIFAEE